MSEVVIPLATLVIGFVSAVALEAVRRRASKHDEVERDQRALQRTTLMELQEAVTDHVEAIQLVVGAIPPRWYRTGAVPIFTYKGGIGRTLALQSMSEIFRSYRPAEVSAILDQGIDEPLAGRNINGLGQRLWSTGARMDILQSRVADDEVRSFVDEVTKTALRLIDDRREPLDRADIEREARGLSDLLRRVNETCGLGSPWAQQLCRLNPHPKHQTRRFISGRTAALVGQGQRRGRRPNSCVQALANPLPTARALLNEDRRHTPASRGLVNIAAEATRFSKSTGRS